MVKIIGKMLAAIALLITMTTASQRGKLVAYMDKFVGICPGKEKLVKGYFTDIKLRHGTNGTTADYRVIFKEDFPPNLSSIMKVEKCKSKENMDTCVPVSAMKTRQYCRLLLNNKANEAWSTFFSCIKPDYQCPMKKGTYVGTNCTYDMSMYNLFPLGGYFWKFTVEIYHPKTNKLVMCFDINLSTGTYIGTNCTYDVNMFQLFPLGGYFWKFLVEVYHPKTNKLVMCFNMDIRTTTKY